MALPLAGAKRSSAPAWTICVAGAVISGASLTARTVMPTVAVAGLKAVVPPLLVVSAVSPLLPLA
jgi:hypothetical protein